MQLVQMLELQGLIRPCSPHIACQTLTHWTLLQLGQAIFSHVEHSHQGTHWLNRLPHSHNVIRLHSREDMVAGIIISLQHQAARECEAIKASREDVCSIQVTGIIETLQQQQAEGWTATHISRASQRKKGSAAHGRVSHAGNDMLAVWSWGRISGRWVHLLAGHDAARGNADTAHRQGSGLDHPTQIMASATGARQDSSSQP